MEAIAALSFACNVIQLVETGCKAAYVFRQAYKDGTTKHNADLKSTTQSLSVYLEEYKQSSSLQLQSDEKQLYEIGSKVASIAESLHNIVKPAAEDGPASTRKKLKNGWRSFRDAGEIKEREAKLRLYQETLNTVILVDLRRQDFDQLSSELQYFIREQAALQQKEHQKTRAVVRHEGAITRADLAIRLREMSLRGDKKVIREQFLNSLRISDMNKRKTDISYNQAGTFEWILKDPNSLPTYDDETKEYSDSETDDFWGSEEYPNRRDVVPNPGFVEWLMEGVDNYWICGKAGSGKSTLMRFLAEHESSQSYLRQWANGQQLTRIESYIWNAGSSFQKSYKGVLATVLFQLCKQPENNALDSLIQKHEYQDKTSITDWHIKEMEECIFSVLSDSARHFCLFIDGLDELEVQQRSEDDEILLRFIERVSKLSNVKCCLSSRPEQLFEVFFRNTKKLRLETLNAGDIRQLCRHSLKQTIKESRQSLNETNLATLRIFVDEFVTRASGVFLWAHLVLGQIRRGVRAHDEVSELRAYLDSLPTEISKLYEHMWARNNGDLQRHRGEAANFINLLMLIEDLGSLFGLDTLNIVQLALMFDLKTLDDHMIPFDENEVIKASMKLKERVSVRSAGLLHVVDGNVSGDSDAAGSDFSDELEKLRNFRIKFIHRTARDFLLTETTGQNIRSQGSMSKKALNERFLHILISERYLAGQVIPMRWIRLHVKLTRECAKSLEAADVGEIYSKLEVACLNSLRHLPEEDMGHTIQHFFMHASEGENISFRELFPLEFNACVLNCGHSTSILRQIEYSPGQLNPKYCAYLLSMFEMWVIVDVDDQFDKLISNLIDRLQPERDQIFYIKSTHPYFDPDSAGSRHGYHDFEPKSCCGVRRSVSRGVIELVFGHTVLSNHSLFSLSVTSFLNALHVSSSEISVVVIDSEFSLSMSLVEDSGTGEIGREGLVFLMEYDLREIFRWYRLHGQVLYNTEGKDRDNLRVPILADQIWNITVRAMGFHDTETDLRGWCRPQSEDAQSISTCLARLPFLPGCRRLRFQLDPNDGNCTKLSEMTAEVWRRSARSEWMDILKDMEYIIPSDDPRVLTQPPPMFLDTPSREEDGRKNLDRQDDRKEEDRKAETDTGEDDEDEEDEFFDANE